MKRFRNGILFILLLLCILFLCFGFWRILIVVNQGLKLANESPFSIPSQPFDNNLLVGKWTTTYFGSSVDTLIIQANRKYKQIYREGETYLESPWNDWWVEDLSDGIIYLHLNGGKYYLGGTSQTKANAACPTDDRVCEEILMEIPTKRYDWIGEEYVDVSGKLVLIIRRDSKNNIILLHLWDSSDRGFPIIGGEMGIFRKINQEDGVR